MNFFQLVDKPLALASYSFSSSYYSFLLADDFFVITNAKITENSPTNIVIACINGWLNL